MTPCAVSVVIPTFRRPELLERCLRAVALRDPSTPPCEVLVVDDGHHAATRVVVESFADTLDIRYLTSDQVRGGPAAARNLGWRSARASVVAFTDDDTVPTPGWLREGLAALREDASAATGRVRVPMPARPRDHERQTAGLETAEFVTANCFVRREALERVGGFDERFRLAWREDSDLQFSLLGAGLRIVPARRAVVVHPVRPARWGDSLLQQRKVFFDALLFKKHPRAYRARVRSHPRWDYYVIVSLLVAGLGSTVAGWALLAVPALAAWALLTLLLLMRRLNGNSRAPGHIVELLATSVAIPPAAVYWRVRGALHFKVAFF